jgi:GNAT superfamily N-acetyltransferase
MSIIFRRGTADDNFATFRVHHFAIEDLFKRMSLPGAEGTPTDEQIDEEVKEEWEGMRGLYEHLTRTADLFWVAEQDGEIVGYCRSSNHGGVRQLTEFFVSPAVQAKGVGKELLARAFPRQDARLRLVIATTEIPAQALYMHSGVYARQLIYRFSGKPQQKAIISDLIIEPAPISAEALPLLAGVDSAILGYQRDNDHRWLLSDRQGWLYRRQAEIVGYGYTGKRTGPFALLNPADFPTVLAHAEMQATTAGLEEFGLWVIRPITTPPTICWRTTIG